MNNNLFIFKNGEVAVVPPKPFCFELAMEGYLSDNPNLLSNKQLDLNEPEVKELEKQLDPNNRIDMLLQYANDLLAIVELKNVQVDDNALKQLINYLAIYRNNLLIDDEADDHSQIIGILVGPEFEDQVIKRIESGSLGELIYGVKIGRYYEDNNWYVFTKWYTPNTKKKDYTKYILNGDKRHMFGKGRLVLEIIKRYLESHPEISFEELRKVFPDSLRKTKFALLHVVELESNVEEEHRYSRYFKETLPCVDGEVVVSSQWGIGNINHFIQEAKKLGYAIDSVEINK